MDHLISLSEISRGDVFAWLQASNHVFTSSENVETLVVRTNEHPLPDARVTSKRARLHKWHHLSCAGDVEKKLTGQVFSMHESASHALIHSPVGWQQ